MKRDQMRIKSYFAKSVDQAMAQAREELGDEAMLLNTRKAPADHPSGMNYEVIFGVVNEGVGGEALASLPLVEIEKAVESKAQTPPPAVPAYSLEQLHQQIDEIRTLLVRSSQAQLAMQRAVPELADVYAHLMSAEIEPALAKDIIDRLEATLATDAFSTGAGNSGNRWKPQRVDWGRLEAFLRVELENRVGLAPRLGVDENPAVVLVGPRGAGKTTSLAKLAVLRARFANDRPARLLSLDMSRAAAHLQLQSVANTHNIAFEEVPAAYLLPGLIAETRQKETVFVDTPGYSGADAKAAEAAAAAIAECPQLDVHLVIPGYMKARDLRLCIERYAPFRPSKLLVTKLDETQSFGSIFSEAARAGLQLSFVAYGPGIPNDIRPASYKDLLSMPVERANARAQAVA
jgi:flagellar biosynthesis protein FlhF